MSETALGGPYRVSELVDVTDKTIEATLNAQASAGFRFDSIHFVTTAGKSRPSMAYIFFISTAPVADRAS